MAEKLSHDEEDLALLRAMQASEDNEEPFRKLFRRYRRRVIGFFSRRGFDAETCRELSQETFFRVYRGRKGFRGDVPFSSWLFQIAANLVKNELRRDQAGKRSGQEKSLDDHDKSQPIEVHTGGESLFSRNVSPPLARLLAREQLDAVRQTLEELPPQMRRTLQLWFHHEYSVKEIATVMNVSPSTVKVQLHQGRKRLRQALAGRFGETAL